jgi:hypothetical protein
VLDILHLHGFKCAGTTFASILESNYGNQVAYIESQSYSDRLPWQMIAKALEGDNYRAASSHLVTLPSIEAGLAKMHVAFVRDPRERIRSAYRFQRRTKALNPPDMTFSEFVESVRTGLLSNYQTRQLSPQDFGGWQQRKGWQLRPELIDFGRRDVFIGLVERFDESLVVLENRMRALGVGFDASYSSALNVEPRRNEMLEGIPPDAVKLDEILYARTNVALDSEIAKIGSFPDKLATHRDRCGHRVRDAQHKVPGPKDWLYVAHKGPFSAAPQTEQSS